MAHITGGGITENLNRALPPTLDALVDRGGERGDVWATADGSFTGEAVENAEGCATSPSWDVPPIIDYVIARAGLTPDEAYLTFNMGVGMSIMCAQDDVDDVCEALEREGFSPFVMGEIVEGTGVVRYR
jgi:phosphoribosylformylglycinamidine cyclo-ligase